jgi:hypothetical protein
MDFGKAIELLKKDYRVTRLGWNGKGMFLDLVTPIDEGHLPYIIMKTADDKIVPWLASQSDVLAEDWIGIE